jgi:hypothetical protein
MPDGGVRFPLFVRAAQHRYFARIKTITGIATGEELRQKVRDGIERYDIKG